MRNLPVIRAFSKLRERIRPAKLRFVPPEVWIAVFEDGDLELTDILNVRLTCNSFAVLARSQAFSIFNFVPFVLTKSSFHYREPFTEDIIARRIERLRFWTSNDVAPVVRECSAYPVYYRVDLKSQVDFYGDINTLIDAFFDALPKFRNLSRLDCRHMPFSDATLRMLGQMENLSTLQVEDCNITSRDTLTIQRSVRVPNVHFYSGFSDYGEYEPRPNVGWLDILDPDCVRRVEISFPEPKISHLRGIATAKSSPGSDLSPEQDIFHYHIVSIISHLSCLEELRIFPYNVDTYNEKLDLPKDTETVKLVSLRKYIGPHQYLPSFIVEHNMQSVELITWDREYSDPDALTHSLQRQKLLGRQPMDVTALTFSTSTGIPDTLLTTINANFLNVKQLNMRTSRVD